MTENDKQQLHEQFVDTAHKLADELIAAYEEAESKLPDDMPAEQKAQVINNIVIGSAQLVKQSVHDMADAMRKKTSELKPEDVNV